MSNKIMDILIICLLLFGIVICTCLCHAEEKVELSIISTKTEITQYEPLIVNFQLKNIGSTDWEVIGLMDYDAGWINMEIGEFGGKFYRYDTGSSVLVDPNNNRILKPNQLFSSQVNIYTARMPIKLDRIISVESLDNNFFLFPFAEPGIYKIRAFYPLEGYIEKYPGARERKMLKSNILEIRVRPWNEKEQQAFNFFKKLEDFAHAVGGCCSGNYEENAKKYETFINLYPDTPYTPYIKLELAEIYHSKTLLPNPNYGRAFDLFSDLAKQGPTLLQDDAFFQLANLQIELSRLKEAKATVVKLLKDYPLSEHIPDARRIKDGLEKGCTNLDDIFSKITGTAAIEAK